MMADVEMVEVQSQETLNFFSACSSTTSASIPIHGQRHDMSHNNKPTTLTVDEVLAAVGSDPTSIVLDILVGTRSYWRARYCSIVRSLNRLATTRSSSDDHCITMSDELFFDDAPECWKPVWQDVMEELDGLFDYVCDGGTPGDIPEDALPVYHFFVYAALVTGG